MFSPKTLMRLVGIVAFLLSMVYSEYMFAVAFTDYANVKIETARASGEIDNYTSLLYKLMIHAGKATMIPQKYAGEIVPEECGTMLMNELARNWHSFTTAQKHEMIALYRFCRVLEAQNENELHQITRALHPSLTNTYDSKKKGGHFVIHYTTTADADTNQITDLKLPKTIAAAMETAYKWFVDKYGKTAKNKDPVDVYLVNANLIGGAAGMCTPINAAGQTCEAYIQINSAISSFANPNYKKFGPHVALGTPAHEYFHAVQFNIDREEGGFMMESSAAWSEGAIFPNNKTYIVIANRLPFFYKYPSLPLWYTANGYYYATMIFHQYMQESLKDTYVNADIWKECEKVAGDNSIAAIGSVLTARGLDWDTVMKNFGMWNYTKQYKDCSKYKDLWPTIVPSGDHATYGVDTAWPPTPIFELGTDYVAFKKPAALSKENGGELFVKYKSDEGHLVKAALLLIKGKNVRVVDFPEDSTDTYGYLEYMTEGFLKLDQVVLMAQVRTTTGTDLSQNHFGYAAACPMITLNSWEADPPSIGPYSSSKLTLKFDVEGCWNDTDYPLKYKVQVKGPGKVSDGVSDLEVQVQNGKDIKNVLNFLTESGDEYVAGDYKIGIQFVFGRSIKPTSKTKMLWLTLTVSSARTDKGPGSPASITLGSNR